MQYHVYHNKGNSQIYPLLLDVQSDIIDALDTRMVIPLVLLATYDEKLPTRLCPVLAIDGKEYLAMTRDMAAISLAGLGSEMANVSHSKQAIKDAIDFLFNGF